MRERVRELRRAKRSPKRNAAWIGLASGGTHIPCVIWDMSETGARLAAPRAQSLPVAFHLFLSKDEKSRRVCRVVWRNDGYLGVKFLQGDAAELELESTLRRQPRLLSAPNGAVTAAAVPAGRRERVETSSLLLPGCGPRAARGSERRGLSFASAAGGMMFMLGGATALFSVAAMQSALHKHWAVEVCSRAANFCTHPEWTGVAAALMGVVYLTTRGMEL